MNAIDPLGLFGDEPQPAPGPAPVRAAILQPPAEVKYARARSPQLKIAERVLRDIGKNNLIACNAGIHLFDSKTGIWNLLNPNQFAAIVQRDLKMFLMEGFTNACVNNTVALLRREVERELEFSFDANAGNDIGMRNGVLEYDGGRWKLRPHRREDFRTIFIPVVYYANAKAPKFERFLNDVFDGDDDKAEKVQCIKELFGYSLMRHADRYEVFVLLIGGGSNGKSVVLRLLAQMIGEKNVAAVQPSLFGNQFNRAFLFRKLVNIVSELQVGAAIDDAALKAITSGEYMNVSKKHEPPFDMKPFSTCWFGTNHMPHTKDFTDALFRRARLISFNRKYVTGVDADPMLKTDDYWKPELPGIVNVCLAAYGDVIRRGGVTDPPSSIEGKRQWRIEADQVQQWTEDRVTADPYGKQYLGELYQNFRQWAGGAGIEHIVTQRTFGHRLGDLGYRTENARDGGGYYIRGIAVSAQVEAEKWE